MQQLFRWSPSKIMPQKDTDRLDKNEYKQTY